MFKTGLASNVLKVFLFRSSTTNVFLVKETAILATLTFLQLVFHATKVTIMMVLNVFSV